MSDQQPNTDPRHQKRVEQLELLFAATFTEATVATAHSTTSEISPILQELDQLDAAIQTVAPERPLHSINKIDLAILRLIVFESNHKKTPKRVLIDEAIELAKTYGSESSSKFVNGALAKLLLIDSKPSSTD
ncbi:MAG: transcription antitermination protein NusB [Patescibacteria group bacterium]